MITAQVLQKASWESSHALESERQRIERSICRCLLFTSFAGTRRQVSSGNDQKKSIEPLRESESSGIISADSMEVPSSVDAVLGMPSEMLSSNRDGFVRGIKEREKNHGETDV